MNEDLFTGKLVRLAAQDPAEAAKLNARWGRDSEFWRLMTTDPAALYSARASQEWMEKTFSPDNPDIFNFGIVTAAEGKLIGGVDLELVGWNHADAYLGIQIGDRDYWNNGYGTEAMQLVLQYGFCELNLHRVTLNVFEYNPRAIHVYEKVGFRHEGRLREAMRRGGRRFDLVHMGILRREWQPKERPER